ncbi:hypothetical protein K6Y31_03380 [Motilimonas cestriensis]|uniref:Hint domain-containing protein n=1 Tax=Motilimonas cestriensis TaxID=2742685 RepID=A0ABS8W649_9GAMM|nr:polymorphic toxin-type HINT domain-containing protein [Motilimonas cestriensis]MCE2593852.1 hypothetical protein [Motilimonas cestriensis]
MPLSFLENFRVSRFFSKATAMLLILTFIVTLYQCSYTTQTNPNVVITKSDPSPLYQPATVEQKVALSLDELALSTESAHLTVSTEIANSTVNDADKNLVDKVGLNDLAGADLAVFKAYREQAEADKQEALQSFETVKDHLTKNNLAPVIFERHEAAVEQYKAKHTELVSLLDELLAAKSLQEQGTSLNSLNSWLKENQTQKAHQQEDFEKLPFNSPKPKVREPDLDYVALYDRVTTPQLFVSNSIDSSMIDPGVTDLAETIDAPHTDAIKDLAAELNHDPIAIYDWVYNNIKFIPSYGSIQGAEYTLKLRQGNAMDTSSLLIALLRSSNIHARYAYGTVEVPIEKVMNWVGGVNSPEAAANLMGQGGIPNTMMTSGGKVVALRFEHTWVETFVDYEPSRGLKNIEADSWIPLDASFKQYEFYSSKNIIDNIDFDPMSAIQTLYSSVVEDKVQGWVQGVNLLSLEAEIQGAVNNLKAYSELDSSNTSMKDLHGEKATKIIPYGPLSSSLPYRLLAKSESFNELPDKLRNKFIFKLHSGFGRDIDFKQATVSLAGKKISLSFVPETADDLALIKSYFPSNSNNMNKALPAYLIKMSARLTVDNVIVEQVSGFTMGKQTLTNMGFWSPSHGWLTSSNKPTVGETHAIALDLQGIASVQLLKLSEKMGGNDTVLRSKAQESTSDLLYSIILSYFNTNSFYDKLDERNTGVVSYRAPSYGVFQTSTTTAYWFDIPRELKLSGLVMDVDNISTISVHTDNDKNKLLAYRSVSGSRMSLLENALPEAVFSTKEKQLNGVSTTRALIHAIEENQKIYTLTSDNAKSISLVNINSLARSEIENALLAGKTVVVHEKPVNVDGWIGSGYLIQDKKTGAAAYKISGGHNGGAIPYDEAEALLSSFDNDTWYWDVIDEAISVGDWVVNHSAEGLADYYGEDSIEYQFWDFFVGGYVDAANAAQDGDYGQVLTDVALASLKLKWLDRILTGTKKFCFVAGTIIHTKDGFKPIEDIVIGDFVKSKNELTGDISWKEVTRLFNNKNKEILNISFIGSSTVLGVTYEHPFWVDGKGWVNANSLQENDRVTSYTGDNFTIKSVKASEFNQDTFNFEVADYHTYFVGEEGIWVHNKCLPKVKKATNANMPHARERAVERGVFPDAESASTGLKNLSSEISSNGFPKGSIIDPAHADRVLVPVGNNGMAVYQIAKNGTAKLKTILIAK